MFRGLPASLPILFVSEVIFIVGYGLFMTLISVRMALEGFPNQAAGLMMSAFSAGFVLGSFIFARFIAGVGHIRVFAACAGVLAATALVHGLYVDIWLWGALRVIGGFASAGLLMVMESWVSGASSNAIRGRVLAVYLVISTLSLATGQWLLKAADPAGYHLFSLTAILFALALVPLALNRIKGPRLQEGNYTPLPVRSLYRLAPAGVVGAFVAGMMVHAFFALAPFFTNQSGFSTDQTAMYMSVTTLVAMFAQWFLGRSSDNFDRRKVIAFMAAVMGISALAVSVAGQAGFVWLVVLTCLLTAFMHTLYSLCIAHTNDYVPAEQVVPAASGLLLSYGTGSILGPWLSSAFMDLVGPAGLFIFLSASGVGLWLFAHFGPRPAQEYDELDSHHPYVPMMPAGDATPVLAELEPAASDPQQDLDFGKRDRDAA
jgi:MFS family permease